jgi:hypothetical protein
MSNIEDVLAAFKFKIGIPSPIWLKNAEAIEKFITVNKLKAVPQESLVAHGRLLPVAEVKEKAAKVQKLDIRGGIRFPHLHFKGSVYLLDEKQWADFSGKVLEGFRAKLAGAKTVSFEKAVELSEAIDTM